MISVRNTVIFKYIWINKMDVKTPEYRIGSPKERETHESLKLLVFPHNQALLNVCNVPSTVLNIVDRKK